MAAGKKARILVVDDEERNRRLMEAMLLPLGYEVSLAVDGEDALKRIAELKPDVVLLDIMMPKLDGFAVVKAIKDDPESARIPVVMVTALSETADRVKALEAGADDFLSKPVDRTELTTRVKSLVKVKAYNDRMVDYQKELEAEVARRTEELRLAFEKVKAASLDTIFRLSRAAEYKDEDTGAHIKRMSQYATCVARELGLPPVEVESILYAVPMHDIGKIGIPDRILLKPAKLTDDEWVIMRRHTEIGAQILEGSTADFIRLGSVIALTHHEKWDGSGYPRGLKGAAIPLVGRITAIADVFDALTSRRPYRQRDYTADEARKIIEEGNGTHFDSAMVQSFVKCWPEILEVKEKYRDGHESRYLELYQAVEDTQKDSG